MAKLKTAIIVLSILSGVTFCTLPDPQELPTNSMQWYQSHHEWNQVIEQSKRLSAVFTPNSGSPEESPSGIQAGSPRQIFLAMLMGQAAERGEQVSAISTSDPGSSQQEFRTAEEAAKQGNDVSAQHESGMMYQLGYGVKKDVSEAKERGEQVSAISTSDPGSSQQEFRTTEEAAKQGNDVSAAQYESGMMYQFGYGVKKDVSEVTELYKKAAEKSRDGAQLKLGLIYEAQDVVEACNYYALVAQRYGESSRESNRDHAVQRLKSMQTIEGVTEDEVIICKWLEQLAKNQDEEPANKDAADAVFHLAVRLAYDQMPGDRTKKEIITKEGTIIKKGTKIEWDYQQDFTPSHKLLELLANQGHADAQGRLGAIHLNGVEKVKKDCEKARYWLTLAANQGHLAARYDLAIVSLYDIGMLEDDIKEFREVLQSKKELGLTDALFYFAVKLAYDQMPGTPTKKDIKTKWGTIIKKGIIIEWDYQQDFTPSHKLLELLANQGHADAYDRLGAIHLNGVEKVKKDCEKARYYYTLAVQGGHPTAHHDLHNILPGRCN